MADKIYVLEVDETAAPTAAPSAAENESLAMWIAEILGDALGHLGLDYEYERYVGGRAPEGMRYDNLLLLGEVCTRARAMDGRIDALEEAVSRIDTLEARLAALEGEPPA